MYISMRDTYEIHNPQVLKNLVSYIIFIALKFPKQQSLKQNEEKKDRYILKMAPYSSSNINEQFNHLSYKFI